MTFLSKEQISEFHEQGILVIPNFIDLKDANLLIKECHDTLDSMDVISNRKKFKETHPGDDSDFNERYFLQSWNKIRYFFDENIDTEDPNLDIHTSLNKIGHNLHGILPNFRRISFDERCKSICKQFGMLCPAICQSMYIFKNARGGSAVTNHQDLTFLWNEPFTSLLGFWIPLEDADVENGCLWYVPGSHKEKKLVNDRRLIRDEARNFKAVKITDKTPEIEETKYKPIEVKAGSLVLIDGYVMHRSKPNNSTRSRQVYTWHATDARPGNLWSELNWIRPKDGMQEFARY